MMLIRAKFCKLNPVRYISHLELMSTLRRSFRRADIPVAFSQGFNPHQQLSMCQPLSVGMTGAGEYFDLQLTEKVTPTDFVNQINDNLPAGLEIKVAREIPDNSKSLMALVNCAVYIIKMDYNLTVTEDREKEMIDKIIKRNELKIIRERRNKKDREIDLRPLIYQIETTQPAVWKFNVSTGSQGNVRPQELIKAAVNLFPEIKEVPLVNVEREELFVRIKDQLYQPFDDQVVGR